MKEMDLFGAGNKKEEEVVTELANLDMVMEDGMRLEYIKNQTKEICLAAVMVNAWALQFVKEQTSEICMAAMKRNGYALKYVKDQTPELC